jgi:hypothetical protein
LKLTANPGWGPAYRCFSINKVKKGSTVQRSTFRVFLTTETRRTQSAGGLFLSIGRPRLNMVEHLTGQATMDKNSQFIAEIIAIVFTKLNRGNFLHATRG